jgi:cytochrome oxidase Cu insertion factor (SCO1/SenC/PrrC family)/thiol-disulfide isomerase/thioredoxin
VRRALVAVLIALAACAACIVLPALASADGDPGSDVLLEQNLFFGSDAGISVKQQLSLDQLLNATAKAGAPVRVAIIAKQDDLGTVTPLWQKPQTYAAYLGYELSNTYSGRLLVVMPNGYGIYWHANPAGANKLASQLSDKHPSSDDAAGLTAATVNAVDRIEAFAGVDASKIAPSLTQTTPATSKGGANFDASSHAGATTTSRQVTNRQHHKLPSGVFLVVLIVILLLYVGWRSGRLRKLQLRRAIPRRWSLPKGLRVRPIALLPTVLLAVVVAALIINESRAGSSAAQPGSTLATNPHLDPGTALSPKLAPGFTLSDQTGRSVSLSQYRGKVVILGFVDAECQTICPLTTQAMLDAKAALGKAGDKVQLLGVNANWKSIQIDDVLNYTDLHGMSGRWQFLTGSLPQLESVWSAYGLNELAHPPPGTTPSSEIDHVAGVYLIDPQGRLRYVFTTYPSYSAIPQFGQRLAQDAAKLLPGHPAVSTHYTYAEVHGTPPTQTASVPMLGGGHMSVGPGKPHLYMFFATWDKQTTQIAAELDDLNSYAHASSKSGLPALTAVDEGSVEPSAGALKAFVTGLEQPLAYPVAVDQTGKLADGYGVQGEPWFVLTNSAGKIVWYREVYTQGWPSLSNLEQEVRNDLARSPKTPKTVEQASRSLAGSPAPLAAIHAQAARLLNGGQTALDARIKSLHGYPVVLNIWGSWCGPCVSEFGLFAKASVQYGKRVAFLGADTDDSSADAKAFLHQHHVSYPSYSTTDTSLDKILVGGLEGTPTTVFINPAGKVTNAIPESYESLGELDTDIKNYALQP